MSKGDPFRREYGTLSNMQKDDMANIKVMFDSVWGQIMSMEKSYISPRDFAIAKTKLQEACMWAVRGITRSEDQS